MQTFGVESKIPLYIKEFLCIFCANNEIKDKNSFGESHKYFVDILLSSVSQTQSQVIHNFVHKHKRNSLYVYGYIVYRFKDDVLSLPRKFCRLVVPTRHAIDQQTHSQDSQHKQTYDGQ